MRFQLFFWLPVIEPQLGGFGIEPATWLESVGSAGWVVGAGCCDFRALLGACSYALGAGTSSGLV